MRDPHLQHMRRALDLARKGRGSTSPNPMVGALLFRRGQVVGEGYHRRAGEPHAEIEALRAAGGHARGADLVVTLEPCCTTGRTGPCTDALIAAGIRRVIAGTIDPDPRASGAGLERLRAAGIEVRLGLLEDECKELIEAFAVYVTRRRPFVALKAAVSLDGRIAARGGDARWITSEASRRAVHELRGELDAVLVGRGTVACDDPLLTCRTGGRDPLRVVLDTDLHTPPSARLLAQSSPASTVLFCAADAPHARERRLLAAGAVVVRTPRVKQGVSLRRVLRRLHAMDVQSVLVEGGEAIFSSFLRQELVDRLHVFVAPVLLGTAGTTPLWSGFGARTMAEALRVRNTSIESHDGDIHLTGKLGSD